MTYAYTYHDVPRYVTALRTHFRTDRDAAVHLL
jgi:hypothetical protein